jgi:hypothetical protein
MKRPSAQKLLLFGALSVGYGCIATVTVAMVAIGKCSMQPDVAETCNVTPVYLTIGAVVALYFGLALAFFRHRISGVD